MKLDLSAEAEALVNYEMQRGRFQSPSEVVETALLVYTGNSPRYSPELEAMIHEGLDDHLDGEVFTEEEARAYLRAMRASL